MTADRKKPPRMPRAALQRVFDLACEMSHAGQYGEIDDDDGTYLGVDPLVSKDLMSVKRFFHLKGEP